MTVEEKKKVARISGSYNEYGYVIRKNSKAIYAAGNGAHGSQDYLYSPDFKLEPIPEEAIGETVYPLWKIELFCKEMVFQMSTHPELYDLKGTAEGYAIGKTTYSKELNPLRAAYECGALT